MPRPRKSQQSTSESSPDTPVRRSARLAGLQALLPASNDAPQTSHTEQADARYPIADTEQENEDQPFDMELAIKPPRRIAAGVELETPLVVTFSTSKAKGRSPGIGDMQDVSGVWAYVSLMTEDGSESLAPPQKGLLRGRTADSIHPVERDGGDAQPFAYATFPDLAITRPGRYCFRVNIIDMNKRYPGGAGNAARVLPALHSEVFDVVESRQHSGLDARVRERINHLRAIGANV